MTKRKDLTGNVYGELTALRESPERLRDAIAWECRCSCGEEVMIERHRLLNGKVKSCGCLRKRSPANTIDMTGKIFGKLTVIERAGSATDGSAQWLCRCACGNTTITLGISLRRGDTASCGCDADERISNARKVLYEDMSVDGVQLPFLTKKTRSDSQSGHKGVSKKMRNGNVIYEVRITIKGKRIYLGTFKDLTKAIAARKAGEEKYHKPYIERVEKKLKASAKKWTTEEDEMIVILKNEGNLIKDIAEIVGRTYPAVISRLALLKKEATKNEAMKNLLDLHIEQKNGDHSN